MRFRLDDDQLALQAAVRSFCADRLDLASVAAREDRPADPSVWGGLAELGVFGLLLPADAGGLGAVAATLAFEVLGEHLAPGPLLWSALAASLIDGVEAGRVRVTGLLSPIDAAPIVVPHLPESDVLLLAGPEEVRSYRVAELDGIRAVAPLDPLTPSAVLDALPAGGAVGGSTGSAVGTVVGDRGAAARLRLLGTVLTAASAVGVAQGALDVARSYALEREQFGRPIGANQAIKHLLADMFVRVELARTEVYAAAATLDSVDRGDDPAVGDPASAASAAKLLAGDAAMANGRTAVQVLGGMGFTWDMLPHYFLKRAWTLDYQFGTAPEHAVRLARQVELEVAR